MKSTITLQGSSGVSLVGSVTVSTIFAAAISGSSGTDPSALHVNNALSELSTEQLKANARANLGLNIIDGGIFT